MNNNVEKRLEEKAQVNPHDEAAAEEAERLSAVAIYDVIRDEGIEELTRPTSSLFFSGLAAGIGISAGFLAMGVLRSIFGDTPTGDALVPIGYAIGFAVVILGRLQLFTENTLTPILPLLADPDRKTLRLTAVLWGVVLLANLIGTTLTSLVTRFLKTVPPEIADGMREVAMKSAEHTAWESFSHGVPAGFFVAALVWMMPLSKGFELLTILLIGWLIAAAGLTHVIVDSAKLSWLMFEGSIEPSKVYLGHLIPTLAGNILGGTGLFAILAYAQVQQEV